MENHEGERAATCGDNNHDQKELYLERRQVLLLDVHVALPSRIAVCAFP